MQKKHLRFVSVATICLILFSLSTQKISGDDTTIETKSSKEYKSIIFEDQQTITFEDKVTATKYIPKPIKKATPPPPQTTPLPRPTFVVTGYSQSVEEGTTDGITASGKPVAYGVCAADTRYYPFGTIFIIPGYGRCVVWDTGGAIKGNQIDAFFPTKAEAFAWGTRTLKVEIK